MRFPLMAIALFAIAATAPATALAQTPSLDGSYTFAAEASDDIHRAIDQVVAGMNFITRPVARSRLRKLNVPYQRVRISQTPSEVTTVADTQPPIVSPLDGSTIRWRRDDGEIFDVTAQWEDGGLRQTFKAEDGQRTNVYSLSPDGRTLIMNVTLTSPRLSKPLTYTLRYRK
jgi:hypothetical protein